MRVGRWVLAGAALAAWESRRRWRDWGSTEAERWTVYPGDDLVAGPALESTRAVSIRASADDVWRWLVQIGQDRGGFYSYDVLERLIGLDVHSAGEVREEWQHLAVGDRVVLVPSGWLGIEAGYSLRVAAVDPGRSLVLRQSPPEHPWDSVWSFTIVPLGRWGCRLVSRTRTVRAAGRFGPLVDALTELGDPITMVMTRRMLLGIKERAERSARAVHPLPPVELAG